MAAKQKELEHKELLGCMVGAASVLNTIGIPYSKKSLHSGCEYVLQELNDQQK